MSIKLSTPKTYSSLGIRLVAAYAKQSNNIQLVWGKELSLDVDGVSVKCASSIVRYLARTCALPHFYGSSILERTEVDHWISFAHASTNAEFISTVDSTLKFGTFIVGHSLTAADLVLWGAFYGFNNKTEAGLKNVNRWNDYIQSLPLVQKTMAEMAKEVKAEAKSSPAPKSAETVKPASRKEEGKFIDLPDARDGEVVVRFPPEASGYLHIGHAKAALLNQYYQQKLNGTLIMRFDDTNPAKENAEFEKVILEDLELLHVKYDKFTHTSDHFDILEKLCERMLGEGYAYVDDTDPEKMKQQRERKEESTCRTNSVEKNLAMWEEMKKGTEYGQKCCVRAKIDMQSVNGCMRDPTMYRCKPEPHVRTGYKYKVYPTYDFACPIVDSIEGVTHALRTTEYHDRDEQYYWFLDTLKLRKPFIWEYARLSMVNTVLSKRKLTWFVQEGYVDGWDDPRFPTVRGVLRQGMTVEGLKQFIIAQGSSRSVVQMEWDKIWSFNKKIIDPIAPRYTAVERVSTAEVRIRGIQEGSSTAALHPKNPDVGTKQVWFSGVVLIDAVDVNSLRIGENATFINWGNIRITGITKSDGKVVVDAEPNLDDKDYKKTPKLTWLPVSAKAKLIPCVCIYFDHIISKPVLAKDEDFKNYINPHTKREVLMLGDPELEKLKKGDIIQLQRKGFFICDSPYQSFSSHTSTEAPLVLFYIPDGTKPAELAKCETPNAVNTKKAETSKKEEEKSTKEQTSASVETDPSKLSEEIKLVGNKVRDLKASKAEKAVIDLEVKQLLALKAKFKAIAGIDWSPSAVIPKTEVEPKASKMSNLAELDQEIKKCGDHVRNLKSQKADKAQIDSSVKELLELKKKFKEASGTDWSPDALKKLSSENTSGKQQTGEVAAVGTVDSLNKLVKECGDKVRELKAQKAEKAVIDAAVKELLDLKQKFKNAAGVEWSPNFSGVTNTIPVPATPQEAKPAKSDQANEKKGKKQDTKQSGLAKPVGKVSEDDGSQGALKKQTRLGLEVKKDENLAEWYSQVITKSEMIEYYDVSGCYILRPWAYSIWESIKDFFDAEIKKLGVQNCYFPMFVSHHALEKEKTHIADFAPEVAWVTKSGSSDLAEPIAIRPTSETVMYPAYAKWIQSHRDLPVKLNQWNNVVRWEFKHPQPFLRTREFLWQEGHTAFATYEEAEEEVYQILDLYRQVYTDLLAIPVIKGRKTEKEKFAGGDFTTTVEAFIAASGRGIQGATSHHLGQNFSKMFEIVIEDPECKEKKHVYQNSWGLTTRTIGVMVMVHADDKGLVLPPNVASIQVVIVPCGINVNISDEEKNKLIDTCKEYEQMLVKNSIRVRGDYRDNYSPGWKFNHWELKGVPIRIEIGPRDVKKGEYIAVRRDTGEKFVLKKETAADDVKNMLTGIHQALLDRATNELKEHTVVVTDFKNFIPELDKKNIILAPFCGEGSCEEKIKKESTRDEGGEPGAPAMGAKSLCIPFDQPGEINESSKCIHPTCTKKPKYYCLFGRSY